MAPTRPWNLPSPLVRQQGRRPFPSRRKGGLAAGGEVTEPRASWLGFPERSPEAPRWAHCGPAHRESPSAPLSRPVLHPMSPSQSQGAFPEAQSGQFSLLGIVFQSTVHSPVHGSANQGLHAGAVPPPTFCTAHKLRICFQMNFYNRFNDSNH